MFLNIRKGILSCDPKLLEVGEIFGFSKRELFLRIRLPYAFPDILAGVRIGMGYSFRAIIGAEMIAASCGIGYMILDAQMFARTDKIIAGVIVIGILGMLCDWYRDVRSGEAISRPLDEIFPVEDEKTVASTASAASAVPGATS